MTIYLPYIYLFMNKNYHDWYFKCDVLLLIDVVEKFGNSNLENYGFYFSNYLGAPGLYWDTILNMTSF